MINDEFLKVSKQLGDILLSKNLTLSTAESCTGGLVSHVITAVSGSSSYFKGGIIAYDNSVKIKCLSVDESTIYTYGAVSAQVAVEMAKGAIKAINTNISCAITGIAGPSGGSTHKPIGLVYIAVSNGDTSLCERFNFSGDRNDIQINASFEAINLILRLITQEYTEK